MKGSRTTPLGGVTWWHRYRMRLVGFTAGWAFSGSVANFDFRGKIRTPGISNSMTYRHPNSRKSTFATEPFSVLREKSHKVLEDGIEGFITTRQGGAAWHSGQAQALPIVQMRRQPTALGFEVEN